MTGRLREMEGNGQGGEMNGGEEVMKKVKCAQSDGKGQGGQRGSGEGSETSSSPR